MDPRHLELLRLFAAYGSVTAVADVTHRTPSAVSQQLRAAERALGAELLEPSGRGLRLTPAGEVLAAGGERVAVALEQVGAEWDAFRSGPSGPVSVAAFPSAGVFLLAPLVSRFADSGVELSLDDADVAESSYAELTREYDIVIGHSLTGPTPTGGEGLHVVPLAREPLDVAMAPGHRLAALGEVSPRDVADEAWIGVPPGYPFDTVLQAIALALGRDLRVEQRLRDNRLIEALVAGGDQLAVLPRFTTPDAGTVVLRPLAEIEPRRYITALCQPHRAERLAVRSVLDELRRIGAEAAQ
ncbi:LysR family transcriptional regulator [Microbacterium halophytorum]|uniref:LysR family transcriptional regulator n=1 Tax=Microbacterium halophytorum TaxID=2067568 RepID=UPI000CFD67B5|nr:LysR family transcriptional regulator [Microbacterium halophytorum]